MNSHQVYISEIENGKKHPSITVLYNIAESALIYKCDK
ncbi:MAG: helix-turn-helix domain-containing protein [Spirochaetia bacterium]|nr:helix-turn-helix domain-containing protein [Spirochaetia bacterium]